MVKTSVYTAQGELWSYTEAASGMTSRAETFRYDKLGRLRITGDALGQRDFVFYDDAGRTVGEMDRRGMLSEYRYDAAGRLAATIRYANQLSGAAIASLYDGSGNPTTATIASVRPAASFYDRWEWLVYDNADRVVQRIETVKGAWEAQSARVTSYAYDGTGQLIRTTEAANLLAPHIVAGFMASPPGAVNRIHNAQTEGLAGWAIVYNPEGIVNSVTSGTYNSVPFLRSNFSSSSFGQMASLGTDWNNKVIVSAGERLSIQTGMDGTGPIDYLQFVVHFDDQNGNYLTGSVISTLTGAQPFDTRVAGFVNVPVGAAYARIGVYLRTSSAGSGFFSLIEPMVSSATFTQTVHPGFSATPVANASNDRVTRSFYSDNGMLIGSLAADGSFTRLVYDKAGRLIDTVGYANRVSAGLRASGSWSQIVAELNASPNAADRHEHLAYDGQGRVRFRLDGNLRPTEYVYNVAGQLVRTIDYGASINASGTGYGVSYVQGQIASLNLTANARPGSRAASTPLRAGLPIRSMPKAMSPIITITR